MKSDTLECPGCTHTVFTPLLKEGELRFKCHGCDLHIHVDDLKEQPDIDTLENLK